MTPTQRQSVNVNQVIKESPNCPRCQKGHLVIRENIKDNKKFLGCNNYQFCDLTFKKPSKLY